MAEYRVLSSGQFKETNDRDESNVLVAKFCDSQIIKSDTNERILTYKISTAAIDREGDTISVDGWKLSDYRKNPVVLWNHLRYEPPIGKSLKIWVENDALMAEAQYTPQDVNPFGYMIYQLARDGYTKGASVGFHPLKYKFNDEREGLSVDYSSQNLLEWSNVTIPANPEALQQARSAGINVRPLKSWAEFNLDMNCEPGPFMTKTILETIHKSCDEQKTIVDIGVNQTKKTKEPEIEQTDIEDKTIMSVTDKFKLAQKALQEADEAALVALKELVTDLNGVLKEAVTLSKNDKELFGNLLSLKSGLNSQEEIKEEEVQKEFTDEDLAELRIAAKEELSTLLKEAMGKID